jgi:hypothetical protein
MSKLVTGKLSAPAGTLWHLLISVLEHRGLSFVWFGMFQFAWIGIARNTAPDSKGSSTMMTLCDECKHLPKQENAEPVYRNELRITCAKGHPVRALRLNGPAQPQVKHLGLIRSDCDACPDRELG